MPSAPSSRCSSGPGRKTARHDSDNLGLDSVQKDRPANQGHIPAISPLPEIMAEHNHWALCSVLFLCERSSHRRLNAQNVKKVRCHLSPGKLLRLPVPVRLAVVYRVAVMSVNTWFCASSPNSRRRRRIQCKADKRSVLPHHHQPARLAYGSGRQQNRVYRAENSRVGAIPSASAATATMKNPGFLVICRNVYRRFARMSSCPRNDERHQMFPLISVFLARASLRIARTEAAPKVVQGRNGGSFSGAAAERLPACVGRAQGDRLFQL